MPQYFAQDRLQRTAYVAAVVLPSLTGAQKAPRQGGHPNHYRKGALKKESLISGHHPASIPVSLYLTPLVVEQVFLYLTPLVGKLVVLFFP
eukprot:2671885-Amphidinium_carterae.1